MLQTILLQEQAKGFDPTQFIMLGLIVVVFYMFMIRPQLKKSKLQKKFREGLSKGDNIVTIGGLHGKVSEIKDSTIMIEVEGGNRLKVEKSAVSSEFTAPSR